MEEYFARAQHDLMQAGRCGFNSFMACAQAVVHGAAAYPLPFSLLEPEFARDQYMLLHLKKSPVLHVDLHILKSVQSVQDSLVH
jgi:hypothetical protein